ncbi:MAG: von Willebrand factor type A domain-containing protein [Verrucomicrobiota bacterium]
MNTTNNEGPQPWIDPALEARVVAGVLGETSAFESAELDRVLADNPELAIFKRRIEAVHALVGAASRPEQPKIQLSPDRRQKLLEKLGAPRAVPAKKIRVFSFPQWCSPHVLSRVAACLVIGAVVVGVLASLSVPAVTGSLQKKASLRSVVSSSGVADPGDVGEASGFISGSPVASAPSAVDRRVTVQNGQVTEEGVMNSDATAAGKPMQFAMNVARAEKERDLNDNVPLPPSAAASSADDTATPVSGKPGFVTSPHSPYAGYVDVRGFPPGTEVKDPYTGKSFVVGGGTTADAGTLALGTAVAAAASSDAGLAADTEKQWPAVQQGRNSQQGHEYADSRSAGNQPKTVVTDQLVVAQEQADLRAMPARTPLPAEKEAVRDISGKFEGYVQYGAPITTHADVAANTDTATQSAPEPSTESPAPEAGDQLLRAQASAIKAFTGEWGKGSGAGGAARSETAKNDEQNQLVQESLAKNVAAEMPAGQDGGAPGTTYMIRGVDVLSRAPSAAPVPMEVAKSKSSDGEKKQRIREESNTVDLVSNLGVKVGSSQQATNEILSESLASARDKEAKPGERALAGANSYTGGTTITGGALALAEAKKGVDKDASDNKTSAAPILGDIPITARLFRPDSAKDSAPTSKTEVLVARQSLQEAQEFYASGRYDLAAKRYEQVLSADPNDIAARRGMEQVNSARTKYQETAFNEARGNMVRQVNNSWERPVRKFDAASPQKIDQPLSVTRAAASTNRKIDEIQTAKQPFSTFSLHVSDVSFQLAKDALARGAMPDPDRIRAEEFYNAFDYGDPAPAPAEEVACRIEQCAHPFVQQRNLVRIALKVAAAGRAAGQPLRLTILLDTSGSMEREDRAASVRRALEVLATLLGPNDRVTLLGFARTPRLLAEQVPGDQANKLVEIAAHTPSEGGTNLELALSLASELALKQKLPSAQNRIVLLTDGAANLGNADPARLARQIEKTRQQGISFDACGVGANGLNDEMLEALTRKGDGRYYFLNKPEDADAGFARQLAGALRPAAENVKVQVVFNPARVSQYRLIGFEKHLLKKEDFRNDKVQAAELSAEEAGVAVYQVQTLPEGDGELGEVFVRFRDPANGQMVEHSWTMPYDAKAPAFDKAAPSMQLAATAALLAERLRGDSQADFNALAPVITNLRGQYPHQTKVADLIRMFERVRQ